MIHEINLDKLGAYLNGEAERLMHLDYSMPLKKCAFILSAALKEGFVHSRAPDGSSWKPLKRPRRKGTKNKGSRRRSSTTNQPLWDTGRLVASMGAGTDHVEQITPDSLVFGTNVSYAAFHNFGTRTIPARPFLGISAAAEAQIENVLSTFIAEQFARP